MNALLIGLAAWVLLSLPAGIGVGVALKRLAAGDALCRCGHAPGAHEHYRRGTDCALCRCPRLTTSPPAAQVKGSTARRRGHLRAVS